MILEHPGQLSRVREHVGLLVIGQAVKSGIRGNEDGEGTRPAEGLNKAGHGLQSIDVLVVCVFGTRGFKDVCHVMFLLLF